MLRIFLLVSAVLVLLGGVVGIQQFFTVRRAHSSFENYYAFRGCTQLLQKTARSATCKIQSGKVIKMVNLKEKWYLDGDLPVCYYTFCL